MRLAELIKFNNSGVRMSYDTGIYSKSHFWREQLKILPFTCGVVICLRIDSA